MIRYRQARPAALTLLALAALAGGCATPADDDALSAPRVGLVLAPKAQADRAVPTGVAVVYSLREDVGVKINVAKAADRDLHEGLKIYSQLVADRAIKPADVFVPAEADDLQIMAVHDRHYLESLNDREAVAKILDDPFPKWQSEQDHRERVLSAYKTAVGGTMLAAELALAHGLAIHLGGGFTHAFADRGGRGCLYADVPIAIASLRQRKLIQRVMVINLGALQANGLASLLGGDADCYVLDIYEKDNYPPAKQPENGAVPIANGLADSDYSSVLESKLPKALDQVKPQLVFFVAGADVVKGDPVGRTALSLTGLVDRDFYVADQVRRRGIPLCMVLGEGSAPGSWRLHYRSIRGLLARYGGVPFQAAAD